jgi:hypothetical protein
MSENTEAGDQGSENKPAPTGNPGTRDESCGGETKSAPTGNFGTFTEDSPRTKKL